MRPIITRLQLIFAGLMIFCTILTGTAFAQKTAPASQTKAAYAISGIGNVQHDPHGIEEFVHRVGGRSMSLDNQLQAIDRLVKGNA